MKISNRFLGVLVAFVLLGIPTSHATIVPVQILDSFFSPDSVTVNQGDTIRWTNNGALLHTSTSGTSCVLDGTWDSPNLGPGGTFEWAFTTIGSFPYFCRFHCIFGMVGTAVVRVVPGVEERTNISSQGFSISLIRPNPFHRTTIIPYSLRQAAPVKIVIYNIVGRRVRTLVDAFEEQGQKQVVWDGFGDEGELLKSDIYFVLFETPTSRSVRKLIHLR